MELWKLLVHTCCADWQHWDSRQGVVLLQAKPGQVKTKEWAVRMYSTGSLLGASSLAQEAHYLQGSQLFYLLNVVASNYREKFTLLKKYATI